MSKIKFSLKRVLDILISASAGIWIGYMLHKGEPAERIFEQYSLNDIKEKMEHNRISSVLSNSQNISNAIVSLTSPRILSAHEYPHSYREISFLDGNRYIHQQPRLLFMTAVYSFDQFLYLQKVLDGKSICTDV